MKKVFLMLAILQVMVASERTKNFSFGILSKGISASATTIILNQGQGSRFPAPDTTFNAVIWDYTVYNWNINGAFYGSMAEIVNVTRCSNDSVIITRAQENTTARTFNTTGHQYYIGINVTAKTINQFLGYGDSISVFRGLANNAIDSLASHRAQLNKTIDSTATHRTLLNAKMDSLLAHRTIINAHTDSILVHRTQLNKTIDSTASHRVTLNAHTDSISSHRTTLNAYKDSIATHRTAINQAKDSIATHRTAINTLISLDSVDIPIITNFGGSSFGSQSTSYAGLGGPQLATTEASVNYAPSGLSGRVIGMYFYSKTNTMTATSTITFQTADSSTASLTASNVALTVGLNQKFASVTNQAVNLTPIKVCGFKLVNSSGSGSITLFTVTMILRMALN